MPTALVIGARNLGFAVIERLLSDGWTVAGAARSLETLAKVRSAGAEALDVDVTDQASVLAALQHLGARHGRVDLAVNAASPYGGSRSGPFGGGPLASPATSPSRRSSLVPLAARSVFSARAPAS
ncbi:MAG: SDR family NAD(P)-dependent oxidoreductase [Solirubrobacteraceae bacterium]